MNLSALERDLQFAIGELPVSVNFLNQSTTGTMTELPEELSFTLYGETENYTVSVIVPAGNLPEKPKTGDRIEVNKIDYYVLKTSESPDGISLRIDLRKV